MSAIPEAVKQRALRVRPTKAIEQHIAKALGHYLRVQILWVLNERVASPSELAKELGVALNRVSNHIKVLKDAGCVELVEKVIVGNSVQRFYRATARIFLDDTEWPAVPATVQSGLRVTLLHNLVDDAIDAVSHGTYDVREGSHMSWTPMIVDEQGREELTRALERCLLETLAIQESAAERLCSADVAGTSYSISLLGYPSIGGEKKIARHKDIEKPAKSTKRRKPRAKKAAKRETTPSKARQKTGGPTSRTTSKGKGKSKGK